jgi:protein-S-isoprenylcysteine O-methyltransferase Ste14
MDSPLLFAPTWGNYILGIPMGLVGVSIMLICIRKYFYHLSGVKVFYNTIDKEESFLEIDGLHRLMRHPLYAGTLLFAWSIFVLRPELSSLIMCVLMNLYLLIGIRIEERKLASEFGAAYLRYKERTPMLIPSLRKSE